MKQHANQKQIQHFDHEEGQYYYSCGCPNCKHEMLHPRSMFSAQTRSKWNVARVTHECKRYGEYLNMNKNFRYSVYRHQYRVMLRLDGLPRTKLSSDIKKNLNDPIYLEFIKLFEELDRDEKGYYLCPVYKIPMFYEWQDNKGGLLTNPNSPSIDRIDNTKKHTLDNLQIISVKANVHKNNATLDELIAQGERAKVLKERQTFK